jgi:hypothetical protein
MFVKHIESLENKDFLIARHSDEHSTIEKSCPAILFLEKYGSSLILVKHE